MGDRVDRFDNDRYGYCWELYDAANLFRLYHAAHCSGTDCVHRVFGLCVR